MKYNKNIIESNIKDAMEYFQSIENNYLSTFKKITDNLINKEYHSITSNYVALFLHQMMQKNVNMTEFSDVIKYIYNSDIKIEHSLHRFFGGSCCDISLTKYLELQQPHILEEEKKYSIWNELSYYFYDIKNGSYGLNKEKIPYLNSLIKFVPEKRVSELYSSGFINFLLLVIDNPNDLSLPFKTIQHNKAFEYTKDSTVNFNQYKPFFFSFIQGMSNESYRMSEAKKKEIFNSFSDSIDNFEEIFLNKVVSYYPTDKYKKFVFDLGMSNFLNIIPSDKIFSQIDKVYQRTLNEEKKEHSHKKNAYDIEISVASELASSIQVSFEDKDFTIDYNIIQTNKPFLENFVYIKLLDVQIMSGKLPKLEKNIREYILKEFSIDDSDPWSELDILLNKKEMIKYFEYLDISDELIINENKKQRIKI
jgi:hypothetical protein